MAFRRRARNLAVLLGGIVLGLVVVALVAWVYFRSARFDAAEILLEDRLDLPPEVLEVEDIEGDGAVRIALRDVVLYEEDGDTILSAPVLGLRLNPSSLTEGEPIQLSDVELRQPVLRLVRRPDGSLNLMQAMRLTASGEEVQAAEGEGRGVLLRDVRVIGGRVRIAAPWQPDSTAAQGDDVQLARVDGTLMHIRTLRDLDARIPVVRVGGPQGWRVVVAELNARLANPDVRIVQVRGEAEETADGAIRFTLEQFQTENSELEASGTVRLAEGEAPRFDVALRAQPLAVEDLQWFLPALPAEGEIRLSATMVTGDDERTTLAVESLAVALPDSRVTGELTVLFGGEAQPAFRDTRLLVEPLDLGVVKQFAGAAGFEAIGDLPIEGQIRGVVATADTVIGTAEGALSLNLTASIQPADSLVPRGEEIESSMVGLTGEVVLASGDQALRLREVRLNLAPLRLGLLAAIAPEQRDRLKGAASGSVTLNGPLSDIRIDAGQISYEVGTAAPTRLVDLSGRVTTEPELSYELQGRAEPLALAALSEVVPALPFRDAQLSGPFAVSGSANAVRFNADLSGMEGSIALNGDLVLGETPVVDVSGRLTAFRPSRIFARPDTLLSGPLSGTFAVRGPMEDLRFNLDLTQGEGTFALEGRFSGGDGPAQIGVTGQIAAFPFGALLGRPDLFPSPLTGTIDFRGGGNEPYEFSVDARGDAGIVDIEGWYVPGEVPQYAVSGVASGLNLAGVAVGDAELPRTSLALTVALHGRGTTPETLGGELELTVTGMMVDNLPIDISIQDLQVRESVLTVARALVSVGQSRLAASGTFGLTRPAPGTLEYTLEVPDLNALTPVFAAVQRIAPRLNGSLQLSGWVDGTLETPSIAVAGGGRGLRYEDWRLGSITLTGETSRVPDGWSGRGSVEAQDITLAGGESLEILRFEADAGPESIGLGLFVQRDPQANVAASGTLRLEQQRVRGAELQRLTFQLGESNWQLAAPTRVAWSDSLGLEVDSLLVRRTGNAPGWLMADGRLPRTGVADFVVRGAGVDLGNLRYALQPTPEIHGIAALDARVRGPVSDPEIAARVRLNSPNFRGGQADTVLLDLRYTGNRADLEAGVWMADEQVMDADLSVPMLLSLENFEPSFELRDAEAVDARLVLDSLPVALLAAVTPGLRQGQGFADGQVLVGGTTDQPQLTGSLTVTDGAFDIDLLGLRYTDVEAQMTLEDDLIRVESLTARSEGTASLSGTIRLDEPDRAEVYLTGELNNFVPIDREDFVSIHASGQAALSGRMPSPVLTGRLSLADGVIVVPELGEDEPLEITDVEVGQVGTETVPTEVAQPGLLGSIRIDGLEVALGQGVWIQAEDEARVQIGGDLVVYRTGEDPRVFGNLLAERGSYTLEIGPLTREFNIVSGQIQFFGTPDFNPSLNILAIYPIRTAAGDQGSVINILVELTGSLQSPEIQLTSDTRPPISETDLFSYLIFGRPSYALGGLRGDLAQDLLVQELAGNVILGPIEQALLGAGVFDYVRISGPPVESGTLGGGGIGSALGSTFGSTAIEGGREFVDEVFFTVECTVGGIFVEVSGTTVCGAGLEWQIDRQWSSRVSYEPIRRDLQLQRFNIGIGNELRHQFSTELRRQWEYGGGSNAPPTPDTPEARPPGEIVPPPQDPPAEAPPEESPKDENDAGP